MHLKKSLYMVRKIKTIRTLELKTEVYVVGF